MNWKYPVHMVIWYLSRGYKLKDYPGNLSGFNENEQTEKFVHPACNPGIAQNFHRDRPDLH